MDEFDVFMDAMSRNIAIRQVIEFARKDNSRQFILITPQVCIVSYTNSCCAGFLFCYCWPLAVCRRLCQSSSNTVTEWSRQDVVSVVVTLNCILRR